MRSKTPKRYQWPKPKPDLRPATFQTHQLPPSREKMVARFEKAEKPISRMYRYHEFLLAARTMGYEWFSEAVYYLYWYTQAFQDVAVLFACDDKIIYRLVKAHFPELEITKPSGALIKECDKFSLKRKVPNDHYSIIARQAIFSIPEEIFADSTVEEIAVYTALPPGTVKMVCEQYGLQPIRYLAHTSKRKIKDKMQRMESLLINKCLKYSKTIPGLMLVKRHGGIYTTGEPDLTGSYRGFRIELEAKIGTNRPTELQWARLQEYLDGGCIAAPFWSFEEFRFLIKNAIQHIEGLYGDYEPEGELEISKKWVESK